MESFGKAIPVTGPNALEPTETVWGDVVQIVKTTKSGHVSYDVRYQRQTNGDEIDIAVRAALQTVVERLTTTATKTS